MTGYTNVSNLSTCNISDINVTLLMFVCYTSYERFVPFAVLKGSAEKLQLIHDLVPFITAES